MTQGTYSTQTAPVSGVGQDTDVIGKRVVATIVDALVLGVLVTLVSTVIALPGFFIQSDAVIIISSLLSSLLPFVVVFGYYIFLEGSRGATVGKMIVGLKVIREDNGSVPGMKAATIRTFARIVDGFAIYLVGFLVARNSPKHQRLGDRFAGTLVVSR